MDFVPLFTDDSVRFGLMIANAKQGDWIAISSDDSPMAQAVLPSERDWFLWPMSKLDPSGGSFEVQLGRRDDGAGAHNIILDPNFVSAPDDKKYVHVVVSGAFISVEQSDAPYPSEPRNPRAISFTVPFVEDGGTYRFGPCKDAHVQDNLTCTVRVERARLRTAKTDWDEDLRSTVEQVQGAVDPSVRAAKPIPSPALELPTIRLNTPPSDLSNLFFVHIKSPHQPRRKAGGARAWAFSDLAEAAKKKNVQKVAAHATDPFSGLGLAPSNVGGFNEMAVMFLGKDQKHDADQVFDELPVEHPVIERLENGNLAIYFAGVGVTDVIGIVSNATNTRLKGSKAEKDMLTTSCLYQFLFPMKRDQTEGYSLTANDLSRIPGLPSQDSDSLLLRQCLEKASYGAGTYTFDGLSALRASAYARNRTSFFENVQTTAANTLQALAAPSGKDKGTHLFELQLLPVADQARLIELKLDGRIRLDILTKLEQLLQVSELSNDDLLALYEIMNLDAFFPYLDAFYPEDRTLEDLVANLDTIENDLYQITDDVRELQSVAPPFLTAQANAEAFLSECVNVYFEQQEQYDVEELETRPTVFEIEGVRVRLKSLLVRVFVHHWLNVQQAKDTHLTAIIARFIEVLCLRPSAKVEDVLIESDRFKRTCETLDGLVGNASKPDWSDIPEAQSEDHAGAVTSWLREIRGLLADVQDPHLSSDVDTLQRALRVLTRHQDWLVHKRIWSRLVAQIRADHAENNTDAFKAFMRMKAAPPHMWPDAARSILSAKELVS